MLLPSFRLDVFGLDDVELEVKLTFKGVSFLQFYSKTLCFAKNGLFLFNFLFFRKFHGNSIFLVSGCILQQSLRKETPLKIQFYCYVNINQPKNICPEAWQQHRFDFGLIFILFLAIWLFAARFSNCSNSLNFEAKINFNTSKVKFPNQRSKCTGLKLYLGPFNAPQTQIKYINNC